MRDKSRKTVIIVVAVLLILSVVIPTLSIFFSAGGSQ